MGYFYYRADLSIFGNCNFLQMSSSLEVFRCPDSGDKKWNPDIAHEGGIKKALFRSAACKRSLSYAYSHNQGKPWTEQDSSATRIAADKYANQDYTDDLFPKGRPINHWSQHNRLNPGRQYVRLDGSAAWDNSRKPLEADPEKDVTADPEAKHDPANDQTGADWWSDPPDK